jgi:hypothetical protein
MGYYNAALLSEVEASVLDHRGHEIVAPRRFDAGIISIGRSNECDVYISADLEWVSRRHARIDLDKVPALFVDEASTNGSFYRDEQVLTLPLDLHQRYRFELGRGPEGATLVLNVRPRKLHPGARDRTVMQPAHERLGVKQLRYVRPNVVVLSTAKAVSTGPDSLDDSSGRRSEARAVAKQLPYQCAYVAGGQREPEDVYDRRYTQELLQLVQDVIRDEAPLSVDLLSRRIAPYWKLQRSSPKLRARVLEILIRFRVSGSFRLDEDNEFVYLPEQLPHAMTFYRIPTSDKRSKRSVEDIPVAEIRNAAEQYASASGFEDLARKTAGVFGFTRLGADVMRRMKLALAPRNTL